MSATRLVRVALCAAATITVFAGSAAHGATAPSCVEAFGTEATVQLPDAADLTFEPDRRNLVSGEPRWGGRALDDPIAWGCRFTQESSSTRRALWATTFRAPRAPDEPAVWKLSRASDVTETSTSFSVDLMRLACNGGVTGVVRDERVAKSETRVVVTFDVAAASPGAHTCPGNRPVRVDVDLGEALGTRDLFDGACLLDGPAVGTSFCAHGPVRWTPPR